MYGTLIWPHAALPEKKERLTVTLNLFYFDLYVPWLSRAKIWAERYFLRTVLVAQDIESV